jgi:hypothetical protein
MTAWFASLSWAPALILMALGMLMMCAAVIYAEHLQAAKNRRKYQMGISPRISRAFVKAFGGAR